MGSPNLVVGPMPERHTLGSLGVGFLWVRLGLRGVLIRSDIDHVRVHAVAVAAAAFFAALGKGRVTFWFVLRHEERRGVTLVHDAVVHGVVPGSIRVGEVQESESCVVDKGTGGQVKAKQTLRNHHVTVAPV
jgi:hypothetical protein